MDREGVRRELLIGVMAIIIFVTSCLVHCLVKPTTKVSDFFSLTEAEISTVELLSVGKTPQIISDVLGLKKSSIRQRLKGIYEKNFVSGQIELVAFYRDI